jgi:hypothetical protein
MSAQLNAFYDASPSERVIGTYLHPYLLFGNPDWNDPYTRTEVIERALVAEKEVLITRNGGLFMRPPSHLNDLYRGGSPITSEPELHAKLAFEEEVSTCFNHLICELALMGIVSEPATPVHISHGRLIDNHALITSAGGGREIYLERTMTPSNHLLRGEWRMYPIRDATTARKARELECANTLVVIKEDLPTLIAGAYSLFSRRQLGEALINSWFVCERIIHYIWEQYLSTLSDKARISRLNDPRTYSAAVRTEVLHSIGNIPLHLYDELNKARGHRNDLAHGKKKATLLASTTCLNAMKLFIEFVCEKTVESPQLSSGVSW